MALPRHILATAAGAAVVLAASMTPTMAAPSAAAAPASTLASESMTPQESHNVSALYSLTAARGRLRAIEGKNGRYLLTLRATSDDVTWFSEGIASASGFLPTRVFASAWAGYGFETDPPTVALLVTKPSGATDTVVAVMTRPKMAGTHQLTARLRLLSMEQAQDVGGLLAAHASNYDMTFPGLFTSAALFIEDVTTTYVGAPVVGTSPDDPPGCIIHPGAQCPGANLAGVDLSGQDLENSNFEGANLTGANLSGANMLNVNLTNANVRGANLSNADLRYSRFASADLTSAKLTSARLLDANLTEALLNSANLYDADLRFAKLSGAKLTSAQLSRANMAGAKLIGADLTRAELIRTNLVLADLTGAIGADLRSASTDLTTDCPNGRHGPCR